MFRIYIYETVLVPQWQCISTFVFYIYETIMNDVDLPNISDDNKATTEFSVLFRNNIYKCIYISSCLTYKWNQFMFIIPSPFHLLYIYSVKQNRESTKGCSKWIVRKKITNSGKGLVSTRRTYASPKWDGTWCLEEYASPVSMLHPSIMVYENLS